MPSLYLREPDVHEWTEERRLYGSDQPITFMRYLEITGDKDFVELVDGVLVEKMAAHLDHEWILTWLLSILRVTTDKRKLGIVLGSRTAVEINEFRGRLPDILFVAEARRDIVHQEAIYGAPDLVIELRSPGDRPSDLIALETDYRHIGVSEIVFVDRLKKIIRILRKSAGYKEIVITSGPFTFETRPDIRLQAEWLFGDTRPEAFDLISELLAVQDGESR
jgi:Uma2 family endonuclease